MGGCFLRWKNRPAAIKYIANLMRDGADFSRAFQQMQSVARHKGWVQQNERFGMLSGAAYSRIKNDVKKELDGVGGDKWKVNTKRSFWKIKL